MTLPARRPGAPKATTGAPNIPRMNKERVSKDAKEGAKEGGGSGVYNISLDYYKPSKGTALLRFYPYVVTDPKHPSKVPVGELWWRRPLKVHFSVGPEEKARLCPSTVGKPCPIEAHAVERRRAGDASDSELKDLKPKDRDIFVVSTVDDPETLLLFDTSFYTFTQMLLREIDDQPEERAMFADLFEGLDLRIRFAETSMGTRKFIEAERIDFVQRKKQPGAEIFKRLPHLDDALIVLDYKALEDEFYGNASDDSDTDETDENPSINDDLPPIDEEAPPTDEINQEYDDAGNAVYYDDDGVPYYVDANTGESFYYESEPEPEPVKPPVKKPLPAKHTPSRAPAKEAPPTAAPSKSAPSRTPNSKVACPDGGTYGSDCNARENCDVCEVWEGCQAEFDRITNERRAAKKK